MPPFRKVDARQAGPTALGILVPPGAKTLVILRPRGLPWDLLPARWDGSPGGAPVFCTFTRDEAALTARRLHRALESAVEACADPLLTVADARGETFQVWVRTEELVWVVCRRAPGESYAPAVFASLDEATAAAGRLLPIIWPAGDARQEVYFNTQQFAQ